MKTKLERKNKIIDLLQENPVISVQKLSEYFNVSVVTIRSDLREIEQAGYIFRGNGKAILKENMLNNLNKNIYHFAKEKSLIGKKALSFIKNNDSIIIDAGSTTKALVKQLQKNQHKLKHFTVMTNGLNIAMDLALCSFVDVFMTGGKLTNSYLSFVGHQAEESLKKYHFDTIPSYYYTYLVTFFAVIMIISNITATKGVAIGGFVLDGAFYLFPFCLCYSRCYQ